MSHSKHKTSAPRHDPGFLIASWTGWVGNNAPLRQRPRSNSLSIMSGSLVRHSGRDTTNSNVCSHCGVAVKRKTRRSCALCGHRFCTVCVGTYHVPAWLLGVEVRQDNIHPLAKVCWGCKHRCLEHRLTQLDAEPARSLPGFRSRMRGRVKGTREYIYPPLTWNTESSASCFTCGLTVSAERGRKHTMKLTKLLKSDIVPLSERCCRVCGEIFCKECSTKSDLPDVFHKTEYSQDAMTVCGECRFRIVRGAILQKEPPPSLANDIQEYPHIVPIGVSNDNLDQNFSTAGDVAHSVPQSASNVAPQASSMRRSRSRRRSSNSANKRRASSASAAVVTGRGSGASRPQNRSLSQNRRAASVRVSTKKQPRIVMAPHRSTSESNIQSRSSPGGKTAPLERKRSAGHVLGGGPNKNSRSINKSSSGLMRSGSFDATSSDEHAGDEGRQRQGLSGSFAALRRKKRTPFDSNRTKAIGSTVAGGPEVDEDVDDDGDEVDWHVALMGFVEATSNLNSSQGPTTDRSSSTKKFFPERQSNADGVDRSKVFQVPIRLSSHYAKAAMEATSSRRRVGPPPPPPRQRTTLPRPKPLSPRAKQSTVFPKHNRTSSGESVVSLISVPAPTGPHCADPLPGSPPPGTLAPASTLVPGEGQDSEKRHPISKSSKNLPHEVWLRLLEDIHAPRFSRMSNAYRARAASREAERHETSNVPLFRVESKVLTPAGKRLSVDPPSIAPPPQPTWSPPQSFRSPVYSPNVRSTQLAEYYMEPPSVALSKVSPVNASYPLSRRMHTRHHSSSQPLPPISQNSSHARAPSMSMHSPVPQVDTPSNSGPKNATATLPPGPTKNLRSSGRRFGQPSVSQHLPNTTQQAPHSPIARTPKPQRGVSKTPPMYPAQHPPSSDPFSSLSEVNKPISDPIPQTPQERQSPTHKRRVTLIKRAHTAHPRLSNSQGRVSLSRSRSSVDYTHVSSAPAAPPKLSPDDKSGDSDSKPASAAVSDDSSIEHTTRPRTLSRVRLSVSKTHIVRHKTSPFPTPHVSDSSANSSNFSNSPYTSLTELAPTATNASTSTTDPQSSMKVVHFSSNMSTSSPTSVSNASAPSATSGGVADMSHTAQREEDIRNHGAVQTASHMRSPERSEFVEDKQEQPFHARRLSVIVSDEVLGSRQPDVVGDSRAHPTSVSPSPSHASLSSRAPRSHTRLPSLGSIDTASVSSLTVQGGRQTNPRSRAHHSRANSYSSTSSSSSSTTSSTRSGGHRVVVPNSAAQSKRTNLLRAHARASIVTDGWLAANSVLPPPNIYTQPSKKESIPEDAPLKPEADTHLEPIKVASDANVSNVVTPPRSPNAITPLLSPPAGATIRGNSMRVGFSPPPSAPPSPFGRPKTIPSAPSPIRRQGARSGSRVSHNPHESDFSSFSSLSSNASSQEAQSSNIHQHFRTAPALQHHSSPMNPPYPASRPTMKAPRKPPAPSGVPPPLLKPMSAPVRPPTTFPTSTGMSSQTHTASSPEAASALSAYRSALQPNVKPVKPPQSGAAARFGRRASKHELNSDLSDLSFKPKLFRSRRSSIASSQTSSLASQSISSTTSSLAQDRSPIASPRYDYSRRPASPTQSPVAHHGVLTQTNATVGFSATPPPRRGPFDSLRSRGA